MSTQSQPSAPSSAKALEAQAKTTDPVPAPLSFEEVHPAVHIYRPDPSASKSSKLASTSDSPLRPLSFSSSSPSAASGAPRTVLICGWMNASLRHVSKYAAPWSLLLPEATIIILLSRGGDYFTSSSARAQPLKKVLQLLEEQGTKEGQRKELGKLSAGLDRAAISMRKDVQEQVARMEEEDEKTLSGQREREELQKVGNGMIVHSFSDGGSGNLSLLLSMLKRDRQGRGTSIPSVRANIFDCSPSRMSPTSGSIAFTMPLMAKRRYLLAHTTRVLLFLLLFIGKWLKKLAGRKTMSEIMRHRLNDGASWRLGKQTEREGEEGKDSLPPRCYLYSKADPLIPFKDVEAHARDLIRLTLSQTTTPKPLQPVDMEGPGKKEELAEKVKEAAERNIVLCRWDRADHCAIGRHDFEGYWTAVRAFLEERV